MRNKRCKRIDLICFGLICVKVYLKELLVYFFFFVNLIFILNVGLLKYKIKFRDRLCFLVLVVLRILSKLFMFI